MLPATQQQDVETRALLWAANNRLRPLVLLPAEHGLYRQMVPLAESTARLPMVDCRFWVAGPDSLLIDHQPEQAMAWSCCAQPGLEREVVWVERKLEDFRSRPGWPDEVVMTLLHEQCHASVRQAAGARLPSWPWPPVVLNVFEAVAEMMACYCMLHVQTGEEPTAEAVRAMLAFRSIHAIALLHRLADAGAARLRLQHAVTLAVGLLAAKDDGQRAAALDAVFGRQLTWPEWTQELGFLGVTTRPP